MEVLEQLPDLGIARYIDDEIYTLEVQKPTVIAGHRDAKPFCQCDARGVFLNFSHAHDCDQRVGCKDLHQRPAAAACTDDRHMRTARSSGLGCLFERLGLDCRHREAYSPKNCTPW